MTPEIPKVLLILQEACDKFGYGFVMIDDWSNNLAQVSKGNQHFWASNSRPGLYPTNPKFSASLVGDKAWTYRILEQQEYRIPKGDYFFVRDDYRERRGDGRELDDAYTYAQKLGYPIFVKPNNSTLGKFAQTVTDEQELRQYLDTVSKRHYVVMLQEVIRQNEYRIFVVDGRVQFYYQRIATTPDGPANLAAGGTIENYSDDIPQAMQDWAGKLANYFKLHVCGIDIFATDINDPSTYTVIELNRSPSLVGIYELGKEEKVMAIWKTILESYFGS